MIKLGISNESIEHRAKLKHGVSHTERIHINEKRLTALHHNVIGVVVTVHQRVLLRNSFNQCDKLFALLLGNICRYKSCPIERDLLHIRHLAVLDLYCMNALQHIYVILNSLRQIIGVVANHLCYANGVQKLSYRTVAVADPNDTVRNCSVDTANERASCILSLLLDFRERVLGKVSLKNGLVIVAVNGAVCALCDKLAALNAHSLICFFNRNHIGKAGHIKNVVNVCRNVDYSKLWLILSESQNNTQACGGDIL